MPDTASRIAGPCAGVLLALGLVSCGTPAEYQHPGDIPEGPGMFTGEDGVARFSTDGDGPDETAPDEGAAGEPNSGAAERDGCECPDAEELEAYREFLRWKAEAVGTPEYREFQDWREWRRQQSE